MFSSWSSGKCEAKKTQDNTSTSYLGADCSQWPPPDPCTVEQGCNREIPEHPKDPLEGALEHVGRVQFELWEGRAQDKESSFHVTDQGS